MVIEYVQAVDPEESVGEEARGAAQSVPVEIAGIVIDNHARPCIFM